MNPESKARDVALIGRIGIVPKLLRVVSRTTGLRFTAVARVTEDTWMACAVHDEINFGLQPGGELVLESTICNDIRQNPHSVIFGQASTHPIYSLHHTPKLYGFESYISVPIFRKNGEMFGTLCALDPMPAKLDDPSIVESFELYAELIAAHIETEEALESTQSELIEATETAKLREQFMAVVGHDLRSPLGAATLAMEVLRDRLDDPHEQRFATMIQQSHKRMEELITNILDFARGRLGGGIPVSIALAKTLQADLASVVDEVRHTHPEQVIESQFDLQADIHCDSARICQLLSNLLSNAAHHGSANVPIRVNATAFHGTLELSVANGGDPIPDEKMERLFHPFSHDLKDGPREGLGLGLYIAAEVARAHRGTLSVASNHVDGTRFTLRMPCHIGATPSVEAVTYT
jgi:signal transduction histidine kinase